MMRKNKLIFTIKNKVRALDMIFKIDYLLFIIHTEIKITKCNYVVIGL